MHSVCVCVSFQQINLTDLRRGRETQQYLRATCLSPAGQDLGAERDTFFEKIPVPLLLWIDARKYD